jgi:hypothetical protein
MCRGAEVFIHESKERVCHESMHHSWLRCISHCCAVPVTWSEANHTLSQSGFPDKQRTVSNDSAREEGVFLACPCSLVSSTSILERFLMNDDVIHGALFAVDGQDGLTSRL